MARKTKSKIEPGTLFGLYERCELCHRGVVVGITVKRIDKDNYWRQEPFWLVEWMDGYAASEEPETTVLKGVEILKETMKADFNKPCARCGDGGN